MWCSLIDRQFFHSISFNFVGLHKSNQIKKNRRKHGDDYEETFAPLLHQNEMRDKWSRDLPFFSFILFKILFASMVFFLSFSLFLFFIVHFIVGKYLAGFFFSIFSLSLPVSPSGNCRLTAAAIIT